MTDTNEIFMKIKELVARNGQLEAMSGHAGPMAEELAKKGNELILSGQRLLAIARQLNPANVGTTRSRSDSKYNYAEIGKQIYDKIQTGDKWTQRKVMQIYDMKDTAAYYVLNEIVKKMPGVLKVKDVATKEITYFK